MPKSHVSPPPPPLYLSLPHPLDVYYIATATGRREHPKLATKTTTNNKSSEKKLNTCEERNSRVVWKQNGRQVIRVDVVIVFFVTKIKIIFTTAHCDYIINCIFAIYFAIIVIKLYVKWMLHIYIIATNWTEKVLWKLTKWRTNCLEWNCFSRYLYMTEEYIKYLNNFSYNCLIWLQF